MNELDVNTGGNETAVNELWKCAKTKKILNKMQWHLIEVLKIVGERGCVQHPQ